MEEGRPRVGGVSVGVGRKGGAAGTSCGGRRGRRGRGDATDTDRDVEAGGWVFGIGVEGGVVACVGRGGKACVGGRRRGRIDKGA